jgi:hypothetical protein
MSTPLLNGICPCPPSPREANSRSASLSFGAVSGSAKPWKLGRPSHRPSDPSTIVSPMRKLACITVFSAPRTTIPRSGLSLNAGAPSPGRPEPCGRTRPPPRSAPQELERGPPATGEGRGGHRALAAPWLGMSISSRPVRLHSKGNPGVRVHRHRSAGGRRRNVGGRTRDPIPDGQGERS